ncbi:MAG: prepilin-type N-terminal cleavage/methylation domain-containing protein [Gammaproteobacteria bacterium]|nr:prepilin-type N-terminal cleavage/methylation domain-containing protein [Gammaproteobacteria bacterium]MBU1447234.1 prepilin-type N-terminal cleavage/methylation domain-containing protein [Gammaproteobacteria bacterium]
MHRTYRQCGFTLTELITIMIIVGILAVVALPRFADNDAFRARATADQVSSALRFGQKVAVAQRRSVDVNLTAAANPDCSTVLAGGNVNCVIVNTVAVAPALPQTVTFDALGRRTSATGSFTVGTTIITIEGETGYVH